jgi:hypothetical protein
MSPADEMKYTSGQKSSEWQSSFISAGSCILLFLSMALPTVASLVYLKASLIAGLLIAIAFEYFSTGRSRLDPRVGLWTLGLAMVSFFFVMEGFVAMTPGASKVIGVYIVWPIIYTFWIGGLAQPRLLLVIHRTAVVATLIVGVYGICYLLTQLGLLPDIGLISWLSFGWEAEAFGTHEGYTQMQFAGMNSLPFLLPYVMASSATQVPSAGRHLFRQICLWTACILGWIVVLAAGRRALFLVVVLTPLLILFFRSFQPETEKRMNRKSVITFCGLFVISVVVLFAGLSSIYQFDVSAIWDRLVTGLDLSSQTIDAGAILRHEQLLALVRGWLEHPILGVGHGASAFGSIRSDTMPWAYELTYLALLFQTGIVGFMAYSAGILWIFYRGVKIIAEGGPLGRMMIPMLVGLCSLLIANATNPYLLKFDGMWMLFLPLAVINFRLTRRVPVDAHPRPARASG